jgi:hypothetical protein
MAVNYQKFDTLPQAWTQAFVERDGKCPNESDPFKWSNKNSPPAIGSKVFSNMNRLGEGVVEGYFVEHGWLGVLVKLDNPPDWYVKQNKGNPLAHLFGTELKLP